MLQRFNGRHVFVALAIALPIVIVVALVNRFVMTPLIDQRAELDAKWDAAYAKGKAAMQSENFAEAVNLFREIKDLTLRYYDVHHPDAWWGFADLGEALERSGAPEEARRVYVEWLELVKGVKANNHAEQARAFAALTRASVIADDYPSAIEFGEHALKLYGNINDPKELCWVHLLDQLEEAYEAVGDFERAIASRRRFLKEVDQDLLSSNCLGCVGYQLGKLAILEIRMGCEHEAVRLFEQSFNAFAHEPYDDLAYVGMLHHTYGLLLAKFDQTEKAWTAVQSGNKLLYEADDVEAYEYARDIMRRVAWLLMLRGEFKEAGQWLEVSESLPRNND